MKYKIAFMSLCIFYNATLLSFDEHTGQMFMFTRPISNSISIHQAAWTDFAYEKHKLGSGIQVYPIYAQSFENLTSPEYFLFDHKRELTIRGGDAPSVFTLYPTGYKAETPDQDHITTQSFNRDILGQWLNENEVENSSYTFNPSQRQAGGVIEFNQDLKKFIDTSLLELWYVSVKLPITYVSNNIGFSGDAKALQALSNNNFQYINVSACDISFTRPTNLQIMIGSKYLNENELQIISSMGVIVPLVEQNSNRFLFEPIQGFNSHFAFHSQMLLQFPLLRSDDLAHSSVCYFLSFENTFLARNKQLRTYDLKGKPYSRYLKVLDIHKNEIVPAMNVLTLRSRVEPFNIFNGATGFRVKFDDHMGEIGYELWAHGTEVVTVENKFESDWQDDRYGIALINEDGVLSFIDPVDGVLKPIPAGQPGQTASNSTINHVGTPDGLISCCSPDGLIFTQKNKYITLEDLDILSAAARSAITHRAYATITLGQKGKHRDFFANLGLYIEASQNNAALSMWGGWAKFGITF